MEVEGQDPSELMIEFESAENPEDVEDGGYGRALCAERYFRDGY